MSNPSWTKGVNISSRPEGLALLYQNPDNGMANGGFVPHRRIFNYEFPSFPKLI